MAAAWNWSRENFGPDDRGENGDAGNNHGQLNQAKPLPEPWFERFFQGPARVVYSIYGDVTL